jgi:hypothetical protein
MTMDEKGPLEELLRSWHAPSPRPGFEARALRRLRTEPAAQSLWQRWFVEPCEAVLVNWKPQAAFLAVAATVALVLGIALNSPQRSGAADFGLDALATFPKGSFTQAYMEMVEP